MKAKRAVGLLAAVALVSGGVALASGKRSSAVAEPRSAPHAKASSTPGAALPRLVDLGAGKCVPCKAMAPILEKLRTDYAGRLEVTFIDVWQRPEEADAYRIHMIPTQIFYGADGRELARHEGFIDREQILAQWKALGVVL